MFILFLLKEIFCDQVISKCEQDIKNKKILVLTVYHKLKKYQILYKTNIVYFKTYILCIYIHHIFFKCFFRVFFHMVNYLDYFFNSYF